MSLPGRLAAFALVVSLAAGCGSSQGQDPPPPATGERGDQDVESPDVVLVEHPFPRKRAHFGEVVRSGDLDLDGDLDLLVAAPGEGVVYLALREGPAAAPRWTVRSALGPAGESVLPVQHLAEDGFGAALEVAELDGDPEPELLVGAYRHRGGEGMAYLFGVGGALADPPILISPPRPGEFGRSVAIGDLDGDGVQDLVVSAPHALVGGLDAGAAWVYFGPFSTFGAAITPGLELANPAPVENGNFGHVLALDDLAAGPQGSLHVAAPGNMNSAGFPSAGQVFEYPRPVSSDLFGIAEEPQGSLFDLPRFGMHIAAAGGFLAVGAPRRNLGQTLDAGLGFLFDAGLSGMSEHSRNEPEPEDLLGYRVGVGNLVGDSALDFVFVALRPRRVFLWDGGDRWGPHLEVAPPEGAGDHFAMGLHLVDLLEGPHAELVMGDSTWDRPNTHVMDDVGRVVVQQVESD